MSLTLWTILFACEICVWHTSGKYLFTNCLEIGRYLYEIRGHVQKVPLSGMLNKYQLQTNFPKFFIWWCFLISVLLSFRIKLHRPICATNTVDNFSIKPLVHWKMSINNQHHGIVLVYFIFTTTANMLVYYI